MQAFAVYLPLSVLLLLGAVALSITTIRWFRQERHTGIKLLTITFLVFLSITLVRMPLYRVEGESLWESLLHGGINALQTIGLDVDLDAVIEDGARLIDGVEPIDGAPFHLDVFSPAARGYVAYVILQDALSLLLCAFALLKALSRWMLKTFLRLSGQTVFFFSALTEDAILLGRSIQESMRTCGKRGVLCYLSQEEELSADLAHLWQNAQLKYAIRLNDSLSHKLFPLFASSVNCILCSPEEQINIDTLASLLTEGSKSRTLRRRNVNYFVFAQSRQAEQAIDVFSAKYTSAGQQSSARLICLLNPLENLAVHILDKAPLYQHTAPTKDGTSCLNILVAGNSSLTDRFLRNAYSCGQMHDCRLRITLADPDAETYQEQLLSSAPLLRSKDHPVVRDCGELRFHTLPHRAAIADENLVKDANYILLAYDDDQDNIRAARRIRRLIDQQKLTDPRLATQDVAIIYIVRDEVMNDLCAKLDPAPAGMPYTPCRMIPIGSREIQNQTEVLFGHELLRRAFFLEQAYMGALSKPRDVHDLRALQKSFVDFMNNAYNHRSSVSAALHLKYRDHARRTLDVAPSKAEAVLSNVEHRRWNAYMIMTGYRPPTDEQLNAYFFQGGATHKCELLRLHPCIALSKPGFTDDLWDISKPALDPLDELSRKVHGMLLKRLRTMGLPVDLRDPKPEDKPAILLAAGLLLDVEKRKLAQRMSKALFTDFKQFDLDIVRHTGDILTLASDPQIEAALRLFWMEE